MIQKIAQIANWLDTHGYYKDADSLTSVMIRMAYDSNGGIIGQFNGGDILKDMGRGAVSGAVGLGAAGGFVPGGIIPGAIVGGISGAVASGLTDVAQNWWYDTRSDQDKASWQAADVQAKLGKIVDIISNIQNPIVQSISQQIQSYATQYKVFIDGYVQKKQGVDLSDNVFDQQQSTQPSQGTGSSPTDASNPSLLPTSSTKKQLKNIYADRSVQDDTNLGDLGNNIVGTSVPNMVGWNLAENATKRALLNGVGNLGDDAISVLKNSPKAGLAGGAVGLVGSYIGSMAYDTVAGGINKLLTGSDANMVAQQLGEIKTEITIINGLTKNDPLVVEAGNEIWSLLAKLYQDVGGTQ